WNPETIYRRTNQLLNFFKTRWDINFSKEEKEMLSGMSFISKKRINQEELFNPNTLGDILKTTFEKDGYIVNVDSKWKWIQFMKQNWIFNDQSETSIHFEIKTIGKERFDDLIEKEVPIN